MPIELQQQMPDDVDASVDWLEFVQSIKQDAQTARKTEEPEWDDNLKWYRGDHWKNKAPEGLNQLVLNKIQNIVLAAASIQTEIQPRIRITPVESNEPPVVFLLPSAQPKITRIEFDEVLELTPEQLEGRRALAENQVSALLQLVDFVPDPEDPEKQVEIPTLAEGTDYVAITDKTVADATQKIIDYWWRVTSFDYTLVDNIVNKGIFGHQPILHQFNTDTNRPEASNEHVLTVWVDGLADEFEKADHIQWDWHASKAEALAKYPEWREVISKHATHDPNTSKSLGISATFGNQFKQNLSRRDRVTLEFTWLKHQKFPMEVEEALDKGLVRGQPTETRDNVLVDKQGRIVQPGEPNWPTVTGIRLIVVIGTDIVFNDRVFVADLPWSWNVNIPKPYSPYGEGEPKRLRDVQKALNRVLSNLENAQRYFSSPQQILPASIANQVAAIKKAHSHAGRIIVVPDDMWQQFFAQGSQRLIHDPPQTPRIYLELVNLLSQTLDDLGNNARVLRGQGDTRAESGKAIQALQSAARGVIGFKSLATERAIHQMVKIWIGFIHDFLPESEFVKIVGGFPVSVLRAIRNRSKKLGYDVAVEIISGRGENKRVKESRAVELFTSGLLSRMSAMKELGIPDVQREHQTILEEQASLAAQTS